MNNILKRPSLEEERKDQHKTWKKLEEEVGVAPTIKPVSGPLTGRIAEKDYAEEQRSRTEISSREFSPPEDKSI